MRSSHSSGNAEGPGDEVGNLIVLNCLYIVCYCGSEHCNLVVQYRKLSFYLKRFYFHETDVRKLKGSLLCASAVFDAFSSSRKSCGGVVRGDGKRGGGRGRFLLAPLQGLGSTSSQWIVGFKMAPRVEIKKVLSYLYHRIEHLQYEALLISNRDPITC